MPLSREETNRRMSERQRKRLADPEARAEHNRRSRDARRVRAATDPGYRADKNRRAREHKARDPEFRARQQEQSNRLTRERRANDPEWRAEELRKSNIQKRKRYAERYPASPNRLEELRESDTVVYLFRHDLFGALKVGITRTVSRGDRMLRHEHQGWTLVDFWIFDSWQDAYDTEQRVLRSWSEFRGFLTTDDMPQNGRTETVALVDVSVDEAISTVEAAAGVLV